MELGEHIGYLTDRRRTELYRAAIASAIRPGDIVVDLGCGSGVLGLLCLQAGAGFVYGIDRGNIVAAARESFGRAGFGAQAEILQGDTRQINLPRTADVLICDHVGYFGFDYGVIGLLRDARRRFLKPGGKLIPAVLGIGMAPVSSSSAWARVARWRAPEVPAEFHWLHEASSNSVHPVTLAAADLLAPAAQGMYIDFAGELPEVIKMQQRFRAERGGDLHGIAGFFDCQLSGEVWMSNQPGSAHGIERPQAFLPMPEPEAVEAGDLIEVTVTARPDDHLVAWEIALPRRGRRIRQSTLKGMLLDAAAHRKMDPAHRPVPAPDARARTVVLGYCDGSRPATEIAAAVQRDHPQLMPSPEEIARFVARVLDSDSA